MSIANQPQNVPVLRFPEFSDGWSESRLGDVVNNIGGTSLEKYVEVDGSHRFISIGNYSKDGKYIDDGKRISSNEKSKSKELEKDDLVMVLNDKTSSGDIIGATILIDENHSYIYNQRSERIICKNTMLSIFLWQYLNSRKVRREIFKLSQGGTQIYVNFPVVKSIVVSFPRKEEQQKIASFLSSVDKKIEHLSQKKKLLEQYKKGMMQNLFRQQIRFKDDNGNDFPDWEEKKLGGVVDIVGGGTPETVVSKYWGGNIQWFTPTEIKQKYLSFSNRTITEEGLQKSSAKILPIGTLLLSTRATVGDVAIAGQECTTNQGFQSLITKENNLNEFWYYWILQNKKTLLRLSSGSTFLEISKSEISKIKVQHPHPDEQTKIANFLSAIDAKINLISTELTHAQTFKKGLLQQMFV